MPDYDFNKLSDSDKARLLEVGSLVGDIKEDEVQNLIPDIVMRIRHGGGFVND